VSRARDGVPYAQAAPGAARLPALRSVFFRRVRVCLPSGEKEVAIAACSFDWAM
jgi:hypothetical protein